MSPDNRGSTVLYIDKLHAILHNALRLPDYYKKSSKLQHD